MSSGWWVSLSGCSIPDPPRFRRALLAWYQKAKRDLPWRNDHDFYRVWVSEIMLQQTRVAAVIPYFERFLRRFPDPAQLAAAPEADVLAHWSGLGYYSRARSLQRAAKIVTVSGFPRTVAEIGTLPGVGPYTAAAVGSIALNLPAAAVDGNVLRVISRLTNDASEISSPVAKTLFREAAQALLDPKQPGDFNQAMMELGATICTPHNPACPQCPVRELCAARVAGTQTALPVKLPKPQSLARTLNVVLLRDPQAALFLVQKSTESRRMAGFWELPEKNLFPGSQFRQSKKFVHQIVNDRYAVTVWQGKTPAKLPAGEWFGAEMLPQIPLATISRKAIGMCATTNIHV